jgi:predicted amidophosphoribosyltransferase
MRECCERPFPAAVAAEAPAVMAAESELPFAPAVAAARNAPPVTTVGDPNAETARRLCRLCRDGYYAFDRARSYGVYNDALHHSILLLKYEEVTRLGVLFAERLAKIVALEGEAFGADVIVPVPRYPDRQRERVTTRLS